MHVGEYMVDGTMRSHVKVTTGQKKQQSRFLASTDGCSFIHKRTTKCVFIASNTECDHDFSKENYKSTFKVGFIGIIIVSSVLCQQGIPT